MYVEISAIYTSHIFRSNKSPSETLLFMNLQSKIISPSPSPSPIQRWTWENSLINPIGNRIWQTTMFRAMQFSRFFVLILSCKPKERTELENKVFERNEFECLLEYANRLRFPNGTPFMSDFRRHHRSSIAALVVVLSSRISGIQIIWNNFGFSSEMTPSNTYK